MKHAHQKLYDKYHKLLLDVEVQIHQRDETVSEMEKMATEKEKEREKDKEKDNIERDRDNLPEKSPQQQQQVTSKEGGGLVKKVRFLSIHTMYLYAFSYTI